MLHPVHPTEFMADFDRLAASDLLWVLVQCRDNRRTWIELGPPESPPSGGVVMYTHGLQDALNLVPGGPLLPKFDAALTTHVPLKLCVEKSRTSIRKKLYVYLGGERTEVIHIGLPASCGVPPAPSSSSSTVMSTVRPSARRV